MKKIEVDERVIDKESGCRGVVHRREGREVYITWDGGVVGKLPWPVGDFVRDTWLNRKKYSGIRED
jgi:hypothetical protein